LNPREHCKGGNKAEPNNKKNRNSRYLKARHFGTLFATARLSQIMASVNPIPIVPLPGGV
jgi:hypothetical protein